MLYPASLNPSVSGTEMEKFDESTNKSMAAENWDAIQNFRLLKIRMLESE